MVGKSPDSRIIEAIGLTIRRDGITLLDELDWCVHAGEHWFILGPNGSGKTTLLNALLGNLVPTSGQVSMLGKTYGESNWDKIRGQVGLVSNSLGRRVEPYQLTEEVLLSGLRGMVNFWGRVQAREASAVTAMMERLGVAALKGRPWAVLSQGERQRLLIGRALIADPKLLFLDEPCAGLDPVARESFLKFLQKTLGAPGELSAVLVTHHVEEILPRFKYGLLLRQGQCVATGPKADLMTPQIMREAFGPKVILNSVGQGWELKVRGRPGMLGES